jgi:hypothetical protein
MRQSFTQIGRPRNPVAGSLPRPPTARLTEQEVEDRIARLERMRKEQLAAADELVKECIGPQGEKKKQDDKKDESGKLPEAKPETPRSHISETSSEQDVPVQQPRGLKRGIRQTKQRSDSASDDSRAEDVADNLMDYEDIEDDKPTAPSQLADPGSPKIDPRTGLPEIRRDPWEIDYELVAQYRWPEYRYEQSSYEEYERITGLPDWQFAMAGTIVISAHQGHYKGRNLRFISEERVSPGNYWLTDEHSVPQAAVTVTYHQNNPLRYERHKRHRQFNPYQFPMYADIWDCRLKNAQITHTVCISAAVESGQYRLTRFPTTQKNIPVKCWIYEGWENVGEEFRPRLPGSPAQFQVAESSQKQATPKASGSSSSNQEFKTPQANVVPSRRTTQEQDQAEDDILNLTEEEAKMSITRTDDLTTVIEKI